MLTNHSETEKEIVVLPDGRFDIIFSYSNTEPYYVALIGLGSEAEQTIFSSKAVMFGHSGAIDHHVPKKDAAAIANAATPAINFTGDIFGS